MKEWNQMGITAEIKRFTGEKIKMNKILNKVIAVYDYKVVPSKYEGKGNCLHLQIEFENEKRVLFTRGSVLIELLEKADKKDFPFKATIVRDNENGPFEFR